MTLYNAENSKSATSCTRFIKTNADGTTDDGYLLVYRFGDRGKPEDWTSPKRRKNSGAGFVRPDDEGLYQVAQSQVRFGRRGELANETQFVSVATNYEVLYQNGESWVQGLLENVPNLGVFVVPFVTLMRASPSSYATRSETEWLYYDGDTPSLDHLQEWRENPYQRP